MVEYGTEQNLNAVFHALADSTRRAILMQVAQEELTVNEIATRHRMSLQGVSKHLKVLEGAGLIVKRKTGRIRRCSANFEALEQASQIIDQVQTVSGNVGWKRCDLHEEANTGGKGNGRKERDHRGCTEGV